MKSPGGLGPKRAAKNPDSRGLIRVSKNPECTLQAAMALENVKELEFYKSVTGEEYPGEYGERVAARRRGDKFERNLHQNNAALLRKAIAELFPSLDPEALTVRDFKQEIPGPPTSMHMKRFMRTRLIFGDLLAGKPVPDLVIEPRFSVPSGGQYPGFMVGPDFMALDPLRRIYLPGEIKSFITRANVAEPGDKDMTRRQAAAQVIGERAVLESLKPGAGDKIPNEALFVFATPFGLKPAPAFIEPIDAPVHEMQKALAKMSEVQSKLKALRAGEDLALPLLVEELPSHFQENCLGSCVMSAWCEARHADTARVLGDAAADLLGPDMDLKKLAKLVAGKMRPVGHERELAEQLKTAAHALGLSETELARRLVG
jgi:hypothetical protein